MEINLIIGSVVIGVFAIASSLVFVKQAHVAVVTRFGKYARVMYPGINLRVPLIEQIYKRISIQNRSVELEFEAISSDQANVRFKALIVYAVQDELAETVRKVAFRFIDEKSFMQTLVRSVEGSIRAFVATKIQAQVLTLRGEIVAAVSEHLEHSLNDWGFHIVDLQINDISFDEAIMRSMAHVVSSNNMRRAAENEAEAQYLIKTRAAEAEARSIRVKAEAEKDASALKGSGNAQFREQVARGLAEAGKIMESGKVPPGFMLFTMWLDGMRYMAEHGKGNVMFLDGSNEGMERTIKQMMAMSRISEPKE